MAELALTKLDGAIGIAEYQLNTILPPALSDVLPSQEEIAALSLDIKHNIDVD